MSNRTHTAVFSVLCTGFALGLLLGCQGGESSGSVGEVSFRVSDAPVSDLESVTITIETMTVNREGDDIVIETFDTDEGEVERVTLDLLDYQGSDSKLIVDSLELEIGTYQNIRLEILDASTEDSYVLEEGSAARHELKVPSDELKLGGFEVASDGAQTFVIEFNLHRAMTYNPGPDRYILKPRGVRVVEVEAAALIAGAAAEDLLDDCVSGVPELENRVYVYEGHDHPVEDLVDAFDPEVDMSAPESAVAPLAVETLDEDGRYEIAFLPAGNYTVAFACDAAADDAELLDGLEIPSPVDQVVELSLEPGDEAACDFELAGAGCS